MKKKKELQEETMEQQVEVVPNEEVNETPTQEIVLSEHDHKMLDHDIKYRAPLSYRHLKLIGWLAMSVMFISMMISLALKIRTPLGEISPSQAEGFTKAATILSYFSALPLPLFLISNFAIILQKKNDYKKLITYYGKIFVAIYVAFIIIYYHYIVLLTMRLGQMSFVDARHLSIQYFTLLGQQGGLVINVFVDLFCCVLIMFFIDYTPKKYFQGKKIILFRLLVLLPLLYEIGSAVLVGLMGLNSLYWDFTFWLPPEVLPLLGKKPIGMIVAFVVICLYIKIREKIYLKRGGTKEGYQLYVQTNRNSFRFSLMLSVTFLTIAIVDFLAVLIPVLCMVGENPAQEQLDTLLSAFTSFTLGKSFCLILVIPFVLLFSYTKKHKNEKMDKMMPLIGIGLVVFAIIETLFFALMF